MLDLIIKNGKCYIDGELKDVDVAIKDGKIQQIGQIPDEAKKKRKAELEAELAKLRKKQQDDDQDVMSKGGERKEIEIIRKTIISYHLNLLKNHACVAAVKTKIPIKEVTITRIACQTFSIPIKSNS